MLPNEGIFREANERIAESARNLSLSGPAPFLCECEDGHCTELIPLELAEYEAARSHPERFFTAPGHSISSAQVVEENDRFQLIDKRNP